MINYKTKGRLFNYLTRDNTINLINIIILLLYLFPSIYRIKAAETKQRW